MLLIRELRKTVIFKPKLKGFLGTLPELYNRTMSQYTAKYIEDKLTDKLGAQFVQAEDESDGCGAKFSVVIVSEAFRGKTLLQKHRLVNGALADELKEIHAFSQKSYTPEEWEKVSKQHQPQ